MKKIMYIMYMAVLCSHVAMSQGEVNYLQLRTQENLHYLTDSKSLLSRVKINDEGVSVASSGYLQPEFHLYWDEVPHFISLVETREAYALRQVYNNKKASRFVRKETDLAGASYTESPTEFKNLKVALDPGHFGGNLESAWLEGRIVKVRGSDLGQREDAKFFEADLTYHTALILKNKLEEQGAEVMITRTKSAGALNKNFAEWMKTSFHEDLQRSWRMGDLHRSFYDTLKRAYTDTLRPANRYNLFQFYKLLDFRERAKKINDFHPNVTFVIHYNASEGSRAQGKERYTTPVATNYAMAFVPGSFEHDELEKPDQKIDFLRLLLSADVSNSLVLADLLVKKHQQVLGVPPIPYDSLKRLKEVVIRTPIEGVFCRNLYLTRAVRGIIVYGESLYQDNYGEAIALSKKDYQVPVPYSSTPYTTSSRCAQVAQAYFESLAEFLQRNARALGAGRSADVSKP